MKEQSQKNGVGEAPGGKGGVESEAPGGKVFCMDTESRADVVGKERRQPKTRRNPEKSFCESPREPENTEKRGGGKRKKRQPNHNPLDPQESPDKSWQEGWDEQTPDQG